MRDILLMKGDCLEKMNEIADGSVHLICTDLPYGTTKCPWDAILPFDPLWDHYRRVLRPDGAILLFSGEPFTSALIMSNPKEFKYRLTWMKNRPTGFANAKRRPLKKVEDICVFAPGRMRYFPQGLVRVNKVAKNYPGVGGQSNNDGGKFVPGEYIQEFTNYPTDVLQFDSNSGAKVHPTQKPVDLIEYLIRTYTLPGETVLDSTMGSGTTGVACLNADRAFIGIERDDHYFDIAKKRIDAIMQSFSDLA